MPAQITNISDLINYIKRRLGYPVVNLEITDQQIFDCIHLTIQKFLEVGYSGTQLRFQVFNTNVNNNVYILPYEVVSVLKVYEINENLNSDQIFSINNMLIQDFFHNSPQFMAGSLLTFELLNQFLDSFSMYFSKQLLYDFNSINKNLYLFNKPNTSKIGVLYYEILDYTSSNNINLYDHIWIKQYATELTKYQWAQNLIKYSGSVLPQGLQLNAEKLMEEAKEKIDKLEEELQSKYALPIDFFVG